jgi:DNA modification methylase
VTWQILQGDVRAVLPTLADESVHCVVTSPPYWGLRDYGVEGQIGQEDTPEEFVATMVAVFRQVRRVLRKDGTLWLNLGDSYITKPHGAGDTTDPKWPGGRVRAGRTPANRNSARRDGAAVIPARRKSAPALKSKDLVGIPWMVAFALRADGWYLRQDIIWHKPNPMPESVVDRCTKAHEYLFLLSKSPSYHYDADAIAEPLLHPAEATAEDASRAFSRKRAAAPAPTQGAATLDKEPPTTRNRRSVWTVATSPYAEAHFATFPPKLVAPCIRAGCPRGGVVLDPFNGAGTTGMVAQRHGRGYVGIELNPEYVEMSRRRITGDAPLLNVEAAP